MNIQQIQDRLKELFEVDQKLQVEIESINKRTFELTQILKEITNKIGWPKISEYGKDSSFQAWMITQHANLEFQVECLELMKALPKGEVNPAHVAYLTDKIRIRQGRKQVYGTQLMRTTEGFIVQSTIDSKRLNKRRVAVGLEPIEEYLGKHNQKYC